MKSLLGAIVLTTVAVSAAVACAPRSNPSATSSTQPTVAAATTTPETTGVPSTGTARPATTGVITGLVGYPAEGHPAMSIYAISTTDRSLYFYVDVPRAATPPKSPYTITGVRPGTYNLFAYVERNDKAGGAYTEYVRCGLRASCSDHTLIDVIVGAGETVRDIEVSDWYGPTDTFPPRPR